MKKTIIILVSVVFLISTMAPIAAAGGRHGHRYHGNYRFHGGGHNHFWFGLGLGVLTAAIVSNYHYSQPPRRVVYYERRPEPVVVSRAPITRPNSYGTPLKATYGQVIVTAAELNVRSGPGPDRAVVGLVRKGDVLAVIDSIPSWFYVREANGRYGWVMDRYTRPAQPLG